MAYDSLLAPFGDDDNRTTSFYYNIPMYEGLRTGLAQHDGTHFHSFLGEQEQSKHLWNSLQVALRQTRELENEIADTQRQREQLQSQITDRKAELAGVRQAQTALGANDHHLRRAIVHAEGRHQEAQVKYLAIDQEIADNKGRFDLLKAILYLAGAILFAFGEFLISTQLVTDTVMVKKDHAPLFGLSIAFFSLMLKPIYDFFIKAKPSERPHWPKVIIFALLLIIFIATVTSLNLYRNSKMKEVNQFIFWAYLTMSFMFALGGTLLFSESLPKFFGIVRTRNNPKKRRDAEQTVATTHEEVKLAQMAYNQEAERLAQRQESLVQRITQAERNLQDLPAAETLKQKLQIALGRYLQASEAYYQSTGQTDQFVFLHQQARGQALLEWLLGGQTHDDEGLKIYREILRRLMRRGMPDRLDNYGTYNRTGSTSANGSAGTRPNSPPRTQNNGTRPHELFRQWLLDHHRLSEDVN